MNLSNMKTVTIEGIGMKSISINGVEIWREPASYTNRVKLSINEDGSIYNGTGYKNGYRIRSGGLEGAQTGSTCTGFIKVEPGDVIRFSGWNFKVTGLSSGAVNAINVADSSFANIGQTTSQPADYGIFTQSAYSGYRFSSVTEEKTGVYKWTVPPAASGAAYIRITGATGENYNGASMIVTVNEEIT